MSYQVLYFRWPQFPSPFCSWQRPQRGPFISLFLHLIQPFNLFIFLCWFSVRLWHCCWRMELMWIPEIIVARLDFLYFLLDFNFMNIGFDLKIKIKIKIASCDYRLVRWFIFSANFLYWRILFCVWKFEYTFFHFG